MEARAEGSVDKNVYWQYLSAWSPYFIIPIGMLAAGVIERSLQVRLFDYQRTVTCPCCSQCWLCSAGCTSDVGAQIGTGCLLCPQHALLPGSHYPFPPSMTWPSPHAQIGQNWWLSVWAAATEAADAADAHVATHYYLGVYFSLGVVSLAFQFLRGLCLLYGSLSAAQNLHADLVANVRLLGIIYLSVFGTHIASCRHTVVKATQFASACCLLFSC